MAIRFFRSFFLSMMLSTFSLMLSAGDSGQKIVYSENFEDTSKHKIMDKNVETAPLTGFNGSAGLRINPHGLKTQYTLPLQFKPQKGKRYIFTIYEKCHGQVYSHVAWEAFKKHEHMYGNWNVKRTPLEGGWTKCEISLFAKDDGDVSDDEWRFKYFMIVTSKGDVSEEAYVDYDNITIREDVPEWHLASVWPTHNKLQAEDGKIRLYSAFDGSFLKPGADPVYILELIADGKLLAKQTLKDQNGVIRAEFGPQKYRGPAILRVTLFDKNLNDKAASRNLEITVAEKYIPKKGEIIIDEKGRAIVDGKPFMPLGFFSSFRKDKGVDHVKEHLKWLHDAGFNVLIEYWGDSWKDDIGTLHDLMQENQIRVFYNFTGVVHRRNEIDTYYRERAQELIKHPAVIGWFIMDEAHAAQLPAILQMRRMLNEMSPGHVTWSYNVFDAPPFLAAADMPGAGIYPIGMAPDLSASDLNLRKAAACATGLWYAPQSMNWANYRKGAMESEEAYRKAGKEPTENELLSVVLQQASHGVTGFFFYSYHDMLTGKVPEWIPQRREYLRNIAKVMRSLEPFIMSGEKIIEIPHKDLKGQTRVVALTDGKGNYRILVIGLTKDNEAEFELSPDFGSLTSHTKLTENKNGIWTFKGKAFSCDLLE